MWKLLKALWLLLLFRAVSYLAKGTILEKSNPALNNWAVLVCSSRYWFNYRHFANTLSVYNLLKRQGYEDDHIIFMSSMEPACDARNPFPGEVLGFKTKGGIAPNMYSENVEVDYRGPECNVESFSRLLIGRLSSDTPPQKKLQTDENSHILIYMAGHGGDEFFKFHDTQEISSQDIGYVFRDMHAKKRYKEVLLVVDTCQASTFAHHIDAPGIYTLTSSVRDENSYAYETDSDLAMAVVDRFTYSMVEYLEKKGKGKGKGKARASLQDLAHSFDRRFLYSTTTLQVSPGSHRTPRDIELADFFSSSGSSNGGPARTEGGNRTVTIGKTKKMNEEEGGPTSFQLWVDTLPTTEDG